MIIEVKFFETGSPFVNFFEMIQAVFVFSLPLIALSELVSLNLVSRHGNRAVDEVAKYLCPKDDQNLATYEAAGFS